MKRKIILATLFVGVCGISNAQFWNYSAPEKVGGTINTLESEESIPVFSKDSSILYFVRTYDATNKGGELDQDVWFSRKDTSGGYSDCKRLTDVNNKFNNAVLGLNTGGTSIYLLNAYEGKKDLMKGVAKAEGGGSKWSTPEAINIPTLDIDGGFYGFHVNGKETVIIISYIGPGSLGEEDLYVSTKMDSSWSAPIHMGSNVNSAGFEISPWLSDSEDTLYFSSNGMGGEGDADIFFSVKQGSWSSWSKPTNVGPIINSPKFDAYFSHSNDQAYWSSNRDSELSDIWKVDILPPPLVEIICEATEVSIYKGLDGSVDAIVSGGVAPFSYLWSNGFDTEDVLALSKGEYTVTVTDAFGQIATATCFVDEPPLLIEPVTVVEYTNLEFMHNFGYNKNKLSTSRGDLKKFVKDVSNQLAEGREKITINIFSSASHVPTKTFGTNEKLAQKRAENMKYDLIAYFEKKGLIEKVNVTIVKVEVQGPAYEKDSEKRDRYHPYQYVGMKTE
tara:strand:- start:1973 stop:3484 length:1512 start_codon:yes stop_codon:yes gene_type:complete